ncbi:MAG: Si-specific NAD(P)(+) transhydrogenase [Gemmatimonadota bacterium]|nr:Si-specific NAD(P)(+) transhydrogenase [Gemmatimonadota bacterium]MDH4348853.1 Si-specific NAD(P)(+) transhydrogenase [Gemmatimonadota bacterium]MDH5283257.1 Si-specific NAD(P)(+) transhydrogenase [Gemmatimonadota bacterium]
MSQSSEYDLVVIGSGPAGEKGAAQAAYFGKRVALVERSPYLGGASINTGTVPSKTLRETALYFSGLRQRGLYGVDYSLREGLTLPDFMYRCRAVVETQRDLILKNLEHHRVEIVWGDASLSDPHTVEVRLAAGGVRRLTTDVILLATGSSPHRPAEVPFGHPRIHDSDSILALDQGLGEIPDSMAVIGGGVIGVEYASIFTALGVRVTLVDGRERLLPFVDGEIASRLQARLGELGLTWQLGVRVERIETSGTGVSLALSNGTAVTADVGLWAAGRQSNVAGLGLEQLGVGLGTRGLVLVNERFQTSVPNIYAAGDVIGFPALASTSMEQARVAMVHAFDLKYKERLSTVIPLAVYAIPEVAMVGLTEEQCRERGLPHVAGRALFERSARGQILGDPQGVIKLLVDPETRRLLGVHIVGESASELIHAGAAVMTDGGTIDRFIDAVYNYPTLTDVYKYAAYDCLITLHRLQGDAALRPAATPAG